MDSTQLLALTVAGFVLPFIHEKLLGSHIAGAAAAWINYAACMTIAIVVTSMSGGFSGSSLQDPTAFTAFLLGKAAGVFALSQLVFQSANKAVEKIGGTATP